MADDGFLCVKCGQWHDKLPLGWGLAEPIYLSKITPAERAARVKIDHAAGVCVLDDSFHFLMGCLQLPIVGTGARFTWTLWVQVAGEDMENILSRWSDPMRDTMEPTPGILIDLFADYPECDRLKIWVHHQPPGMRPLFEVLASEHPLYREQSEGISEGRLREIAMAMYHPNVARGSGLITPGIA